MIIVHLQVFLLICFSVFGILCLVSFIFVMLNLRATKKADHRGKPKTYETDPVIIGRIKKERIRQNQLGETFSGQTEPAVIKSERDGISLYGRFKENKENGHLWVISSHCFKSDHRYCLSYGKAFYEQGFSVLLPDLRGHGKSGGRFIGMGYLDRQDMRSWVHWIRKKDPEAKIILHGISMGAAVVMMASGDNEPGVEAYVEDCGFSSVWDIFVSEAKKRYHLPAFPLIYLAGGISKIIAGYGFSEASCLKQVKKCKKPMMVIHGEKDAFVPVSMGKAIYEAIETKKDLYLVTLAGHCQARDYDEAEYITRILEFLKENGLSAKGE